MRSNPRLAAALAMIPDRSQMSSGPFTTRFVTAVAASLAFLALSVLSLSTASAADPTTIEELVMYGVPQESQELFRYEFGSDTFSTVGNGPEDICDLSGISVNAHD